MPTRNPVQGRSRRGQGEAKWTAVHRTKGSRGLGRDSDALGSVDNDRETSRSGVHGYRKGLGRISNRNIGN